MIPFHNPYSSFFVAQQGYKPRPAVVYLHNPCSSFFFYLQLNSHENHISHHFLPTDVQCACIFGGYFAWRKRRTRGYYPHSSGKVYSFPPFTEIRYDASENAKNRAGIEEDQRASQKQSAGDDQKDDGTL